MSRPRVLLADDHAIILEAFETLLSPHCEVVGAVTDGRELMKAASRLKPDIIVSDISMPQLNGLDACRKIRKIQPDVKLIFLTVNEDPDLVAEAMRSGADGYLLKNSAASELFQAIEAVLSRRTYITPLVANGMIGSLMNKAPGGRAIEKITTRQREVLQLLAEGNTMKQTARILCVTPRTVAFHKYRIMDELNIETSAELIKFAIKNGLV
ncbi:MAG: response regulator transcription factor [Gammaproteobacteria bacterium]|nr:response regulator transcription factor [Gammaproteobacteria bacterium]NNJ80307.1 response regulator transcription factor [Xanthomonadales bacterium]